MRAPRVNANRLRSSRLQLKRGPKHGKGSACDPKILQFLLRLLDHKRLRDQFHLK